MNFSKYVLDGMWDLTFTTPEGEKINTTAKVPGNIEPVLKETGLVDDYMPSDTDEATLAFEGVDDWCYKTFFDADNFDYKNRLNLVFEGIDTIAEVYLNGEKILDCQSMHMAYKTDVTEKLKPKANELMVIIRSAQLFARKQPYDMLSGIMIRPNFNEAAVNLRKARHQWGWDNAPRLVTSGIFRSVYIEEVPPCHFEEVYLHTIKIDEKNVHLGASWAFETEDKSLFGYKIKLTLADGENIIYEETNPAKFVRGSFKYTVPRECVKLWWPRGFGEAKLYNVKIEIIKNDEILATSETPFGIRTLVLERTEDILADGTGEFVFKINDEKVHIRGANWKPLSPLGSEADAKTKEENALMEIINLNCNMVRVWGGGIYEDEFFYDFCDRNGLMVWQDFMVACEIPATDDAICKLIADETKQIVIKYRNHPSLALWCADNENDECLMWLKQYSQNLPSESIVTRKILRDAVLKNDPYRCYLPSSPYASDENYRQRFSGNMTHFQPESHFYVHPFTFFERLRNLKSKFIGETGPITICAATSNTDIIEKESTRAKRLWNSEKLPSTKLHQDDGYFTAWRHMGRDICMEYYGRDFTFDEISDYILAINIYCAEVYKDIIEYSRATRWNKTGVIWWSLYDMWEMLFNYSIIDCDGKRKLPYYWIKTSQQEFALMAVRKKATKEITLFASNDTLETQKAKYTITAYDENGNAQVVMENELEQEKNSSREICEIGSKKPELIIIKWTTEDGETGVNHAFSDKFSFDTAKKWIEIIQKEYGEQFEELK